MAQRHKSAVNLSPIQFRKSSFAKTVRIALAEAMLDPRRLEMEITETTLIDSGDAVLT